MAQTMYAHMNKWILKNFMILIAIRGTCICREKSGIMHNACDFDVCAEVEPKALCILNSKAKLHAQPGSVKF
jgi:hypothetical protein